MSQAVQPRPRRAWGRTALGVAITVACLILMARRIDGPALLRAMASFRWGYLLPGIAALATGYALRILRWRILLSASGARIGYARCVAPFLGSIALNNVLPLRAGDAVRALVFPASMGISRTTATSSLMIERLIDLVSLVGCLAIGVWAVPRVELPHGLGPTGLLMAIVAVVALCLGFLFSGAIGRSCQERGARAGDRRIARAFNVAGALLVGFEAMSRPGTMAKVFGLSMLVWLCESGLFFFALIGMGIVATPAMALLVMAIATLSTLVPSSPGYVGPFHLAVFATLTLLGASTSQAGSYAVIVHLALWAPTTIVGAIAIAVAPHLFGTARGAAAEHTPGPDSPHE